MSAHDKSAETPPQQERISNLTHDIAQTRAGMSATLEQLEHRLSPGELGEKAKIELDHLERRVKAMMHEGLEEAREGLAEARAAVKEDIQSAIAHTKQSMRDATLGRVEDIATKAGDVMNETRDTLIETIRQNPLPAAIAGIGVAWLLMNRSSASRRRNGPEYRVSGMDIGVRESGSFRETGHEAGSTIASAFGDVESKVEGAAHDAADATGRMIHSAEGAASRFAHDARDATGRAMHSTAEGARRVERGIEHTLQTNPIAVGAVAIVVGAAVGYALPRTRAENELLGEARHRLLDGAAHLAHEASDSIAGMAGDAGESMKHKVESAFESH